MSINRVAKIKNSATVHWTIPFHRGKHRMVNLPNNTTTPKTLILGVHCLDVCCPVAGPFYQLAPLVSSVHITKFPPPSLLVLS